MQRLYAIQMGNHRLGLPRVYALHLLGLPRMYALNSS